jgi:hypothetical protein
MILKNHTSSLPRNFILTLTPQGMLSLPKFKKLTISSQINNSESTTITIVSLDLPFHRLSKETALSGLIPEIRNSIKI